jgi:hypothetical protein
MAAGRSAGYKARRQEAERQRRERASRRSSSETSAESDASPHASSAGEARRAAATSCAWCGGAITPRSLGPIPKWCSVGCRRRAWEQGRAAASGRWAVEVVEHRVEVRVPATPTRRDWVRLLGELAKQVDDGRIYDRDVSAVEAALTEVVTALERRRPSSGSGPP